MLAKRFHEEHNITGNEFREYGLWIDLIVSEETGMIEDLHLIYKEDNNGTMHLFTFKELKKTKFIKYADGSSEYIYNARLN